MLISDYVECLRETGQLKATEPESSEQRQRSKYRQIFRLKEVYLLAAFILIYVGVGVTIGGEYRHATYSRQTLLTLSELIQGWTVTYIINVRGGGSSSGYVSSGFFGGMLNKISPSG